MDITVIIRGIGLIIFGIFSTFVIPWLKANTTNKQLKQMLEYVRIAVGAAEQLALVKGYNGDWKKAFVTNYLLSKNLKVDIDSLDLMIEDAVMQLHSQLKE